MDQNFDEKFKKLPPHVQNWMAEESTDLNGKIAETYDLTPEQIESMVWLISRTIIGDIELEGLADSLKNIFPEFDDQKIKNIALDIIISRFWPIRDFMEGAEVAIGNLGGTIPQDQALYKEKYDLLQPEIVVEKEAGIENKVVYIGIDEAIKKHPEIENQFITSKPINLKDKDQSVNGTFYNWLEDYRQNKGAPPHSSIERTDYLFNGGNGMNLDNSERTILGSLLKIYDEGSQLPIDPDAGKVVLSELFHNGNLMSNVPKITVNHSVAVEEKKPETQISADMPDNIIDLRKK
ncbi:MAG: hypothetical protein WC242_02990 [Candidatus Paceibacterota bacterium]|jgi:hypothetical protein